MLNQLQNISVRRMASAAVDRASIACPGQFMPKAKAATLKQRMYKWLIIRPDGHVGSVWKIGSPSATVIDANFIGEEESDTRLTYRLRFDIKQDEDDATHAVTSSIPARI